MKKLHTLLTVATLGFLGMSAGTAQAGNYRPNVPGTSASAHVQFQGYAPTQTRDQAQYRAEVQTPAQSPQQKLIGPAPLQTANVAADGTKTACFFGGCYGCSSCYSVRPYFPAVTNCSYGGCGVGYGGYGGYGYGGYGGYGYGGYGGFGGYGGYAPVGGYGAGYGGYGYGMPVNGGYGMPYGGVYQSNYYGGYGW